MIHPRRWFKLSAAAIAVSAKTRKTTIRVTAAGIAVLGLTTGAVHAAFAAESPSASAAIERSWSYVPEFSSAPALAQGQLVDSGGAPVSGATVILFPVPVKPRAGDKLTPLARTTTGAGGSFTVRLPVERDALLTSPRSAGARNLLVMAFTPGGVAEWYYSLPAASTSGRAGNAVAPAGTGAASIPFAKLRVHPEARAAQPSASSSPAGCGIIDDGEIGGIPVVVGMRESGASDAITSFTYSTSSSMTLGAGVSYTSSNSGFSANGTTTQTSGGSYTFANMTGTGNNHLQGDGVYDEYEQYCDIPPNSVTVWNLQQEGVTSEAEPATPGTPSIPAGDCVHGERGAINTYSTGTQQTFSAGAQLSVVGYGINLSSQDGFTQDSSITYQFTTYSHPICGSGGYPGVAGYTGVIGVHSTIQPS
jgi:hypothetical protein